MTPLAPPRPEPPRALSGLRDRAAGVRWLALVTFLAATVAFMPRALAGQGVFAPLDILEASSPWRDALATSPHVTNIIQNDVVQAIPVLNAVIEALRHGHWLTWTPYVAGGEPIGALPSSGVQSPFNLPLLVLPLSYGLGFVTALRLLFSQWCFYLFLRRFRLSEPVATFGAVAYTFCGTNVVLLGRINAYLILPAMLWAVTRVLQRRGPADVVLLALASALAWLEGFPGGFVNSVAIAGLVALVLAVPAGWGGGGARTIARRAAGGLGLVACGFALCAGLVAVSVLPFERILGASGLVAHRHYTAALSHLPAVLVPGTLSVGGLGSLHNPTLLDALGPGGAVSGAGNAVELEGGAGLVVFAVAAAGVLLALAGRLRLTRTQRALYVFGLAAVAGGISLIYFDSPLLELFYALPLLGISPVNRFRIIINLGFVLLACLALEGWWRARAAPGRGSPLALRVAAALGLLAMIQIGRAVWPSYHGWLENPLTTHVRHELLLEAAGSLLATLVVFGLLRRFRRSRAGPAVLSGVLAALAAGTFATTAFPIRFFTPTVSSRLLFPRTAGHAELARLAGQRYRILGSGLPTFYADSSLRYRYLDLRGLSISTPPFRRLVEAALPEAYALDPFKVIYNPGTAPIDFASPALDDLAVGYYVGATADTPFARDLGAPAPVATRRLSSSRPPAVAIAVHPQLSAVAVALQRATGCEGAHVSVRLARPGGSTLAEAARPALDAPVSAAGLVPFAIPTVPRGPRRRVLVTVTADRRGCRIAAGVDRRGRLIVAQLVREPGMPPVAADRQGVFYRRPAAHPIIWATGRWTAAATPARALDLAVAPSRRSGDPIPVAGAGAPSAGAAGASVGRITWRSDGFDVHVRSGGRDLVATGFAGSAPEWSVTIDGHPSRVASVDGALLGAVVGAGAHDVRFRYEPPDLVLGAGVSGVSVLVMIGLWLLDRRRSRRGGPFGGADPADPPGTPT